MQLHYPLGIASLLLGDPLRGGLKDKCTSAAKRQLKQKNNRLQASLPAVSLFCWPYGPVHFFFCGERGIRTPDTLMRYTRFPGEPVQPLLHLSNRVKNGHEDNINQQTLQTCCYHSCLQAQILLTLRCLQYKLPKAPT